MKPELYKNLILMLAICVSASLSAQNVEILTQQGDQVAESSENDVVLTQQGANNEAFIQQINTSGYVGIEATQSGNSNRINLMQGGYYNVIRINQDGLGNVYDGDINGQDVQIDLRQQGNENVLFQSLLLNNTGFSVIQEGNGNEIIHTGTISNSSGMQIQQYGSEMKLIIQSN